MPRFSTSDGLSLHYTDRGGEGHGHAAPILCLAGLTRNSDDFTWVLPHLAGHRVICMDYRGRGQSDCPEDPMTYTIVREAQDAVELLDHLEVGRVTLLGTSRGGLIAMLLSVTAPDRLAAVILNDIGPEVTDTGLQRILDYVGKVPPSADLDAAAEALMKGHADSFPDVPLSRWRAQAGFMYAEKPGGGLLLRYDPRLRDALIGQAGAGEAPDLWQLFEGLRALPLAVIRGANSDLLSAATVERMAARHPGMIAATVPDRGHVPFLDEPEALAAIHALLARAA